MTDHESTPRLARALATDDWHSEHSAGRTRLYVAHFPSYAGGETYAVGLDDRGEPEWDTFDGRELAEALRRWEREG